MLLFLVIMELEQTAPKTTAIEKNKVNKLKERKKQHQSEQTEGLMHEKPPISHWCRVEPIHVRRNDYILIAIRFSLKELHATETDIVSGKFICCEFVEQSLT